MKTTHGIDHSLQDFREAIGIDKEKMDLVLQHLGKMQDENKLPKKSMILAEVVKLSTDPMEASYLGYIVGRMEGEQHGSMIAGLKGGNPMAEFMDDFMEFIRQKRERGEE